MINQIIINRNSSESYTFQYSNDVSGDLVEDRAEVVKFLDDAIDILMRMTNKHTKTEIKTNEPIFVVKIDARA